MATKKTGRNSSSFRDRYDRMSPQKQRRFLMKCGGAAALVLASAGALATYDKRQRTLHDLSTLGQGNPTVVQIHDTSCADCRRLKSRTSTALDQHEHVDFRLADLAKGDGSRFARKYGVQKTTLLLFDGRGEHLQTVVGLRSVEDLSELFELQFSD
ncbi:MAG: thioredoxin family protein [Granulosicoccus sp.]